MAEEHNKQSQGAGQAGNRGGNQGDSGEPRTNLEAEQQLTGNERGGQDSRTDRNEKEGQSREGGQARQDSRREGENKSRNSRFGDM